MEQIQEITCNGVDFIIQYGQKFIHICKFTSVGRGNYITDFGSWERLHIHKREILGKVLIALSGPIIMEFNNYNIVLFANVNVEDNYDIISVMDRNNNLVAKFKTYCVFNDNYVLEAYNVVCYLIGDIVFDVNAVRPVIIPTINIDNLPRRSGKQ